MKTIIANTIVILFFSTLALMLGGIFGIFIYLIWTWTGADRLLAFGGLWFLSLCAAAAFWGRDHSTID
jgi:hypothetical protein